MNSFKRLGLYIDFVNKYYIFFKYCAKEYLLIDYFFEILLVNRISKQRFQEQYYGLF